MILLHNVSKYIQKCPGVERLCILKMYYLSFSGEMWVFQCGRKCKGSDRITYDRRCGGCRDLKTRRCTHRTHVRKHWCVPLFFYFHYQSSIFIRWMEDILISLVPFSLGLMKWECLTDKCTIACIYAALLSQENYFLVKHWCAVITDIKNCNQIKNYK